MKKQLYSLFTLVLLSLLTAVGTTKPYVFKVDVWSDGKQNLYCLNDRHTKTHYANQQRADLLEEVNKLEDTLLVAEDMGEYTRSNPVVKHWVTQGMSNDQLLHRLTSKAKHSGDAESIEFRHETTISAQGGQISAKDAFGITDKIEQEIKNYNDGPLYNSFYHTHYAKYEQEFAKTAKEWFSPFKNSQLCLSDVCKQLPLSEPCNELVKTLALEDLSIQQQKEWILKLYPAYLLDLRIVHSIATHPQYKHIILCAGAGHLDRIQPALEQAGFELMDSITGDIPAPENNYPKMVNIKEAFTHIKDNITDHNLEVISPPQQSHYLPLFLLAALALVAVVLGYRRKKLALLIPFALLSVSNTVKPYVYQVDVWEQKGKPRLICCHDEHYPAQVSLEQKKRLFEDLTHEGAVIGENMFAYDGSHPELDKLIHCYHDGPYHFLCLTEECQKHKVAFTNVEFRHKGNASLIGFNISAKEVIELSDYIKEEVKQYKDGLLFDKCYQQYLEELQAMQAKCEPFIKQLRNKNETLYHAIPKTRWFRNLDKVLINEMGFVASDKNERKNDLLTMYDAALIDMRILHSIAHYNDKEQIYICAGGWHIQHLEEGFKQLGYHCIHSIDGTITVNDAEDGCLPKAVALDEVFTTISAKHSLQTEDATTGSGIFLLLAIALFILAIGGRLARVLTRQALLLLLLGLPALIDAHIFRIEKWTKNKQGEQEHNLFTCLDFHTSRFPQNQKGNQQRTALAEVVKNYDAAAAVEDMYLKFDQLIKNPITYDSHSIRTLRDKEIPSDKTSPLIALYPELLDTSLPNAKVKNVEFRQASYGSHAEGIISAQDCLKATEHARKKIEQFNDNNVLNEFYKTTLEKHSKLLAEGKPLIDQINASGNATLKELFKNNILNYNPAIDSALKILGLTDRTQSVPAQEKIKSFLHYYDAGLIDAFILHALHQYKDNSNIFVCAGFKHIENIEPILQKLGYKKVATEGKGLLEGNNTMEPDALNIAEAMKRLDPNPLRGSGASPTSQSILVLVALLLVLFGLYVRSKRRKKSIA